MEAKINFEKVQIKKKKKTCENQLYFHLKKSLIFLPIKQFNIIHLAKKLILIIYIYNKKLCPKNNRKKINIKIIKSILLSKIIFLILLNLSLHIELKNSNQKRLLLNDNEITLKVNGSGMHCIFNGIFNSYTAPILPCPSEIYIDNNSIPVASPCNFILVNNSESIIKLVWDHPLNSTSCLFSGCNNITEINFTNFDTSFVTEMSYMFVNCHSLTSVDVSNFNTVNVEDMYGMFEFCFSLKSLNLSNFNTSKVVKMGEMFFDCYSLTTIDLSNFNTTITDDMYCLFCHCFNLEFINLKNFRDTTDIDDYSYMFYNISNNSVICLVPEQAKVISREANKLSCVTVSCEENWRLVQKKG